MTPESVMKEEDARTSNLDTWLSYIIGTTGFAMIMYHIWYILSLPYEPQIHSILHLGFAFIILIVSVCATPSYGQEATQKDFAKFCADIQGRWVGNVTWVTDWPGFGKKGDKVTAYWEGRTSEGGKLLIGKFYGGDGAETAMTFYDPARKRIRSVGVDSAGTEQIRVRGKLDLVSHHSRST